MPPSSSGNGTMTRTRAMLDLLSGWPCNTVLQSRGGGGLEALQLVEELVPGRAADVEDQVLDAGVGVGAHAGGAVLLRAGDAVAVDQMRLDLHRVALLEMGSEALTASLADQRRAHDGRGDRVRVATGFLGVAAHLGETGGEALRRGPDRHPAVAQPARAPQRRRRAAADPERRAAGLQGLRVDGDPAEREEPARERRLGPAEQLPERPHRLVRPRAALARIDADRLEVLAALAADPDAEHDTPAGEVVERRELAGDERRVPERQEDDGRADRDPLRAGREARERDGDVEDRVVERDVVARPDRVVPRLLGQLGHDPEEPGIRQPAEELPRALEAEPHACSAARTA